MNTRVRIALGLIGVCVVSAWGVPRAAHAQASPAPPQEASEQASEKPPAPDDLSILRAELEALKLTVADQAIMLDASMASQVESEIDALSDGSLDQKPNSVSIYGFMDMGLQRYVTDNRLVKGLVGSTETTFVSGNNNIYFDARPLKGWRALMEVRFALHPYGNVAVGALGPAKRQDTSIIDSTSASGRSIIRLGSIIIERAVMEWRYDGRLTLQMGYFLTPWGIWNIDHGTPTLISLIMPGFLLNEAVLRQQTGVNAFGTFTSHDWAVGYHAYVSNGRTTSQFDLDDDKSVGGRLTLARYRGGTKTTLGTSMFYGSSEDELRSLTLSGGGFDIDIQQTIQRREATGGLDLSFDWKGLRVRAEGVARRVTHASGKYPPIVINPLAREPNRTELYVYGLAAYRFDWVEPFVYAEYINAHKRTDLIDSGYGVSAGLNLYLSTVSQIKLQYAHSTLDSVYATDVTIGFFASRYVLSF